MAKILEYLKKIKSAKKGVEVRDSIHDSIEAMNNQIENQLGGMIENGNTVIENMHQEIQSIEDMKADGSLNMKPEDLTEAQWGHLKDDLTNYYKRYESTYLTTTPNENNIPINIKQYNTLSILEVYIEGRILNKDEYTVNGTNSINLKTPLSEIGTEVLFVVYRSVCANNKDLDQLKGPKGDSGAIVFDTVADMKAEIGLVAGDTCQIIGNNIANDGTSEIFRIVNDTSLISDEKEIYELENGLFAIRVKNEKIDDSYIIEEITVDEHYDEQTKTHYWITHIPHTDKNGNLIKMKFGLANDIEDDTCIANETARSFANRHNATLCINGGVFNVAEESAYNLRSLGLVIKDKKVVADLRDEVREEGILNLDYQNRINICGVTDDNTLIKYNYDVKAETVLADGCDFTIPGFGRIMVNGESTNKAEGDMWSTATYSTTKDTQPNKNKIYFIKENEKYIGKVDLTSFDENETYYEQNYDNGAFYQFMFIGQNTKTKDFYIFTCNGKGIETELGMSHEQGIAILKNYGCDFAWQLDGGGSTSLIYRGEMLNNKTDGKKVDALDGKGYTERNLGNFIYFSREVKTDKDNDISNLNKKIGELRELLKDLDLDIVNKNKINNATLVINNSTNHDGVWTTFQKNGEDRVSMVADNTARPGGWGIWNHELSKTIFGVESDGKIRNIRGYLGSILDIAPVSTDINNLNFNTRNHSMFK